MREKLKNVCIHLGDGTWVPTTVLKCMDFDFVRESVASRIRMPSAIGESLAFLIKRGYVEIKPTRAGREFVNEWMKLYEQREEKLTSAAKERRRMRSIAQKGPFHLDEIHTRGSHVTVYGHYGEVGVEVSSICRYVKLKKGQIVSYVDKGKLYDKIMTDISTALMSPEGRLRLLKVDVNQLKWLVDWYLSLIHI